MVSGNNIVNVPIIPIIRNITLLKVIFSFKNSIAIIEAHTGIVNSSENTSANGSIVSPQVQQDCPIKWKIFLIKLILNCSLFNLELLFMKNIMIQLIKELN